MLRVCVGDGQRPVSDQGVQERAGKSKRWEGRAEGAEEGRRMSFHKVFSKGTRGRKVRGGMVNLLPLPRFKVISDHITKSPPCPQESKKGRGAGRSSDARNLWRSHIFWPKD